MRAHRAQDGHVPAHYVVYPDACMPRSNKALSRMAVSLWGLLSGRLLKCNNLSLVRCRMCRVVAGAGMPRKTCNLRM